MSARDKLVERACRLAEVLRVESHASHALDHPERPVRGVYRDPADEMDREERDYER